MKKPLDRQIPTNNAEKFTSTVKSIGVTKSISNLIKTIIFAVIVSVSAMYLMAAGLPVMIGWGVIAAFIGIIIVDVIQLIRAKSVIIKPDKNVNAGAPAVYPDEAVHNYFAGVWRYGPGAGSYSVLDTGKNLTPENAILITNRRVWAVTVPMEGAGQIVSGTDISKWQWMNMQKEIQNKLEEMINMPFGDLIKACGKCTAVEKSDIIEIKYSDVSNGIIFITKSHGKLCYSIRNKEDYERAKRSILMAAI